MRQIMVTGMAALLAPLMLAGAGAAAENAPALRDVRPIDAHVHFYAVPPELREALTRFDLRFVDVTVIDPYETEYAGLADQHRACREVARSTGRSAWLSSFDPKDFESPGFAKRVIAELEQTFRDGAAGVKMYKTIGMYFRTKSGKYVMPDDPAFAPVLEAVAAHGKTLYAHIAEPAAAFQPLEPSNPDYGYYSEFPKWHVYGRKGFPSKAQILAARDRMLEQHPRLRVVGCHLGSMEEDVDQIAARLDRHPNFAVDTAARVTHLTLEPREKLRAFLIKYQDRILYATDGVIQQGAKAGQSARDWAANVERDWKFFATSETVEYQGRKVQGLALPPSVLRRLYRENAMRWVPGLAQVGGGK